MAVVGFIVQEVIRRKKGNLEKRQLNFDIQKDTLRKLLQKAKNTEFGQAFGFGEALKSVNCIESFQQRVPVYHYEKLFEQYWHKLMDGRKNITWPGKVKYFGLTAGTSNDSSKRVPVTTDMIRSIRRTGTRQFLSLVEFDLPPNFFEKSVLMLGGSTSLTKKDKYYEGDLSGIIMGGLPSWFNIFYKPGVISKERDWNTKLNKIVKKAHKWDIGGITGVPSWVQILLERIIEYHKLNNIHEIWPDFRVYAHGGVSFAPYKKSIERLMGKEVYYLETYLASEGFLAYQRKKDHPMQLVIDNGIFFEFIPFNDLNFNSDGTVVDQPQTLLIDQVNENTDYALLISTNAGAWRYLIGDTIRFKSVRDFEIVITGRTKHFLSICGEHLSVDNMTRAVSEVSEKLNIDIQEFTVAGIPHQNLFAHKWYMGTNQQVNDPGILRELLDKTLSELNDDYAIERKAALKDIFIEILPVHVFYDWMRLKGKEGGQHKFPRVIGNLHDEWETFVHSKQ
jgi:hypothetical protein